MRRLPQFRGGRSASSRALSINVTHESSQPELIPNCSVIPRAFGVAPGPTWKSQDTPASAEVPDSAAIVRRKSGRRREDELALLHREENRAKILKTDDPMRQPARSTSLRPERDSANLSLFSLSRAPANSSAFELTRNGNTTQGRTRRRQGVRHNIQYGKGP